MKAQIASAEAAAVEPMVLSPRQEE
jgi:hypothetical protein